ncbi:MAG: hypothetical protein E7474_10375 [Ruminococcaceae bacterium]|nr:hypothetical protein [Oscillospiraceae bacterium]
MKQIERGTALLAAGCLCMMPARADALGEPFVIFAIPLLMLALAILALSLLIRAIKRLRNKKRARREADAMKNESINESEENKDEKTVP